MKPNKRNRLFSPLRTACAAALLLCQPATASIYTNSDPVVTQAGVDLNKQICMADAYIKAGGKGLANKLGESINCTANDVEITNVVPLSVWDDPETPEDESLLPLKCDLGNPGFKFNANITVRANASERWDTTFYLPLNEKSPQIIQGNSLMKPPVADAKNCSIVLPKPGEEGASQLDGDQCGDIRKSDLTNDEYTLMNEPITIACNDDDGDSQLDFSYCAAWENQTGNNCDVDDNPVVGQVPSTKSKCKCDTFNIPVIINAPAPVKELVSADHADEPSGTFIYKVTITKPAGALTMVITDLSDIVRSSTDASVPLANFNLNLGTVQHPANSPLTLLGNDPANTCDGQLPKTLTQASPTFACNLVMKVDDENLPDWDSNTPNVIPTEDYQDFVRATIRRDTATGSIIGNNQCDLFDADTENDAGTCTGIVTVNMVNVDPAVTITKTPVASSTVHKVNNVWYIDQAGPVTYEVVITNTSTVDALSLTSLADSNTSNQTNVNLLNDSSGTPACNGASNLALAKAGTPGSTFTCRFVTQFPATIAQGGTYTNTVAVGGNDNENRPASNTASVGVTLASPGITLVKEVAAVLNNTPLNDVTGFAETAHLPEPGGKVVYRFTITNNNSLTQENLTLSAFIDDVLFASLRADESSTQRTDKCDFTKTIVYGTPYTCTLVADVTGNALDPNPNTVVNEGNLVNTAQVKATTPNNTEVTSNQDSATVMFDNVPPSIEGRFALKATVFLSVKNITFENIFLKSIRILGVPVKEGAILAGTPGSFVITNDGGTFGALPSVLGCQEPTSAPGVEPPVYDQTVSAPATLEPSESYNCAFSIRFAPGMTLDAFNTFTSAITGSNQVKVEYVDEEGSSASADASVTITAP